MRIVPGSKGLSSEALRLSNSIPASYTIYKDGSNYYAEANSPGLSDLPIDTDAAVVINAAMAGVNSTYGGKVALKTGEFDLTSYLQVNNTRVTLQGEGMGKTILKYTGSYTDCVVRVPTTFLKNIEVRDLTIDASNLAIQGLWYEKEVENFLIDNVEIKNVYGKTGAPEVSDYIAGLAIVGLGGGRINNCWIHDLSVVGGFAPNGAGIWITGNQNITDIEQVVMSGNRIENLVGDSGGTSFRGILLDTWTLGFTVQGGFIRNITTDGSTGISAVSAAGGTKVQRHIISGVTIEDCYRGMYITSDTQAKDIAVADCIINRSQEAGLFLEGTHINVTGCIIKNSGLLGTLDDKWRSGIFFPGATTNYNNISHNQIYDDQGAATQKYGIYSDGADYNMITNNIFTGNVIAAINAVGANDTVDLNDGFVTEAWGSGTILNGTTSETITHGMDVTPFARHIQIIGMEDPTNSVGTIWINNAGGVTFDVTVENDPGASNWDFGWHARRIR